MRVRSKANPAEQAQVGDDLVTNVQRDLDDGPGDELVTRSWPFPHRPERPRHRTDPVLDVVGYRP